MMSEWQKYTNNRKILRRENHVLIVPEAYTAQSIEMPLFCDVCGIRFGHMEDEKSYQKFKCCSSCANTWAYSHKKEWEEGWRPSNEQIEKAIEKRLIVNPDLVFE